LEEDRLFHPEIEKAIGLVRCGALMAAAGDAGLPQVARAAA
jgi:histidine ammonia-lyase